MTLLPVVERELRVAARRLGTVWTRVGFAAGGVLVAAYVYFMSRYTTTPPGVMGPILFGGLTAVALLLCALAGMMTTADSISSERRQGTLGLLFLTDLRGYDIVLGKLAATGTVMSCALFGLVPVLTLPLLLGGVSGKSVILVALTLGNQLFFSLTAGLFVSSLVQKAENAVGGTILVLLGFNLMVPGLAAILKESVLPPDWTWLAEPVFCLSPGAAFVWVLQSNFGQPVQTIPIFFSLAFGHALSWAMLGLACWRVPRATVEKPVQRTAGWWSRFKDRWQFGGPRTRLRVRQRALELGAFAWLSARDLGTTRAWWCLLAAVAAVWFWAVWKLGRDALAIQGVTTVAFLLNGLMKASLAGETVARFSDDRQQGTMELLLTTPLTVRDLVLGQLRGVLLKMRWPVGILLCLEVLHFARALTDPIPPDTGLVWLLAWCVSLTVFVADVFTLAWVGPAMGLSLRQYSRAVTNTQAIVLIVPWGLFGGALAGLAWVFNWDPSHMWEGVPVLLWGVISLGTDWVACQVAKHVLLRQLRGGFAAATLQRKGKAA